MEVYSAEHSASRPPFSTCRHDGWGEKEETRGAEDRFLLLALRGNGKESTEKSVEGPPAKKRCCF